MPRRTRRKTTPSVFRVHIELLEVEPVVWRKALIHSTINLAELHQTLNELMGWTNSHLHQFLLRDRVFGDPKSDPDGEAEFEDERKVRLDELLGVGQSIIYEYDFGDGWTHKVEVEKKLEDDHRVFYPLCLGGARACPPEDCGGPGGYERLLEVLQDKDDEEHNDLVGWVGGYFDPEGFDVNRTNQALRALRS